MMIHVLELETGEVLLSASGLFAQAGDISHLLQLPQSSPLGRLMRSAQSTKAMHG